jgi:hypothetical protein
MALMANCEASTSSSKGHSWSGRFSAMSCSMSFMRVFTEFCWASPKTNLTFFLSRSVSGLATSANPGIKGQWYPNTPSVLWTPETVDCSVGHSSRPRCLTGSKVIFPFSTTMPK